MSQRILWKTICALQEILPDTGVAALLRGKQVAIFRVGENEDVFALGNFDPFSNTNVLARGLVGDLNGELVVASPMYKQHFKLRDGVCLEDAAVSVPIYPVRVFNGAVQLGSPAETGLPSPRSRLVVVGNGMSGMRVVEELLRIAPERFEITVIGAEAQPHYNRTLLTSMLAGEKSAAETTLHPVQWYARHDIRLLTGDPVERIDRVRRIARTHAGYEAAYDRLLIATGAVPVRPAIPGSERAGVVTVHEMADVEALVSSPRQGRTAVVVVGGGVLGVECAAGLRARGFEVTLVHRHEVLMERQIDARASALLQAALCARGVEVRLETEPVAFEGEVRVSAVRYAQGDRQATDLVLLTTGVTPNIALAMDANLQCARGIVVDDTMQTYDPRVYAVGECAQHRGVVYGQLAPLMEQASVCAAHLSGLGHRRYPGSLAALRLRVTGLDLYAAGDVAGGPGCGALILQDPDAGTYKRLVLKDRRMLGAVLFGDVRDASWYESLIRDGVDVGAMRNSLQFGRAGSETVALA